MAIHNTLRPMKFGAIQYIHFPWLAIQPTVSHQHIVSVSSRREMEAHVIAIHVGLAEVAEVARVWVTFFANFLRVP